MKRTDIHRPSAINPAEYEWVAFELIPLGRFGGDILGDCEFLREERNRIRRHMERTGGTYSRHEHGGNCGVCGSVNAIYTVLFYHSLTNSYIRMGQDCAQKCEMAIGGDLDAFKTAAKDALTLKAGKKKAAAILEVSGIPQAWAIYNAEYPADVILPYEETTIIDIIGRLVEYGGVSEKQMNFVKSLVDRINRREEIAKARAIAYAAAADLPVPTGRTTIEGTVLTLRGEEGRFGFVTKMLVQHVDGWKVWGTAPSKIDIKKGDKIRFDAAVEASKNDPKFGYFSRPTKTEVNREEKVVA
jgi:hypothetical protein